VLSFVSKEGYRANLAWFLQVAIVHDPLHAGRQTLPRPAGKEAVRDTLAGRRSSAAIPTPLPLKMRKTLSRELPIRSDFLPNDTRGKR
jgi:hypothetical protein